MTEHLPDPVLLKDLAGQTGLSPSRFGRAFKLSMGISPHRWQMNQRVLEAQEMLRDGKRSQADIALATGFAEQSHFSRVFKEVVGCHPARGSAPIASNRRSCRGPPSVCGALFVN